MRLTAQVTPMEVKPKTVTTVVMAAGNIGLRGEPAGSGLAHVQHVLMSSSPVALAKPDGADCCDLVLKGSG